jgi:hypothetical protein
MKFEIRMTEVLTYATIEITAEDEDKAKEVVEQMAYHEVLDIMDVERKFVVNEVSK